MKILLFLFLCAASLCAQQSTLDRIRDLQDQRIEQSAELYGYLQSPDEKIRSRALIAIANIQDTNAIAIVVPLLKDPKPMVRRDAAFCLGMIGKQSAARQLFDQFSVEKDSMAIDEIAQSIGKCGDRSDLARLLGMSGRLNSLQYEAIPLSCARFAIRGIATDSMYRLLTSMIGQGRSAYWSTYALMRMNDSVIAKNFSEVLLPGLSSSSPEIVMWTELILGNSTDPAVKKRIAALTSDKYDWRIRINAERALSNTRTQEIVDLFKTLIDDSNEHVSLTAITTFNALLSDSDFIKQHSLFEKIVNDSVRYSFRQRAEAALILGKRTGEYSLAILARHLNTDDRLTPYLLKAMGETRSSRALPVIALYFQSSNSTIEMAAVSAYQNIVRLLDQREKEKFLSAVIPFFSWSDPGLSLTVASVFEDTAFSIDTRKQYMRQLLLAFNTMESVNDVEPMQELLDVFGVLKDSSALESVVNILHADESSLRHNAARAYESITGREYMPQGPKRSSYTPLFAPEDFKLLRNFSGADIRTNRGTIRIMFRPDAAPFTTLSFIKLVQKNFYRGLTFHRVVSNFVIQGGDPLGNGSGGPGYTLRTEVSPDERYSEGAVGLASAGKDTEGSQFFITHCPTPHLDGRYTIFAYTKDQQVVDTIMVGDVINGIQLLDAQGNLK